MTRRLPGEADVCEEPRGFRCSGRKTHGVRPKRHVDFAIHVNAEEDPRFGGIPGPGGEGLAGSRAFVSNDELGIASKRDGCHSGTHLRDGEAVSERN